ncbi:hypothetical protein EVAR_47608_1 [Eumeta japonica]|uniref:Uncharacterized protein n=1 Tax=Eumeta variegata TaxID=151549 RepID=A0A4C1WPN0_EUMVA|nr:hypothetical protein EVAR_47608_1 [Eumeta japonica]
MVASHHRPLGRVHEPNVRNCGSSRTEQYYYRNDEPSSLCVLNIWIKPAFALCSTRGFRPAELALGHLRYSLTDVPPQSNSPPGSVLEPDHAGVYDGDAPGHPSTSPLCTLGTKHRAPADVSRPRTASAQPSKYRADRTRALRFTETTTSPGQTRGLAAGKIRGRPERGSDSARAHDERTRELRPGPAPAASASLPNPTRPGPQSQSLFRSYGSNLPTSLTYIILSTRGSSPWRPAADMGTNRRDISAYVPHLNFQGPHRESGHRANAVLFAFRTISPFYRIPWNSNAQAEKKTLPGPLGGVFRPLWDRLTREQLLFTRNPSPRQSSRASLEYLLLPPRSAPTEAPGGLTPRPFCALRRARPTRYGLMTARFKRAVARNGRRQFCLPKLAHLAPSSDLEASSFDYPEGNFGRNQLLDGSISLRPIPSSDDRFARQNRYGPPSGFPDFDLTRHSSPSFGSQHLCSERPHPRIGNGTPGVRDADRDPRPSSPSVPKKIETPLHFRYAFQFDRYTRGDSTTRTHARLLGPCYKTGPASARNRIIADGYAHGQRLHGGRIDAGAQRRGPHSGGTSNATTPRVGPDAPKRVRVSYSYRPIGRPVGHRRGPTTELRSPGSRTALRPTSNGSRCLTEREVHAVPGDDTHDPRPPTRPRKTEIDGRPGRPYARSTETNVESLPLDGVYHPLRAALSSNPTLRRVPLAAALRLYGPGTLYGKAAPFKTNLDRRPDDEKAEPPEHHMSRDRYDRAIRRWALSCSLAATKEILADDMVRGRLDIRPRDDARFDVESAYGGYIVTKISRSCAAHIAPVVSSIRRFDYDTELPYVESDLCRDANTKTTRATFVCAAA